MGIVQEKFQVTIPHESMTENTWVDDKSARVKKGTPGREGRSGGDYDSKSMDNAVNYNSLPPGMDLEDQEMSDQRKCNYSLSGGFPEGKNAGDVTQDISAMAFKKGFTQHDMRPTDDQYTREHNDAFYDEIKVDGVTGFVERNNVLDRE